MKPAPFEYVPVSTASEAAAALHELGEDAKILAGGQSLIPLLNFRLAQPSHLVDVNPVGELDYIRLAERDLVVGATTRMAALEGAAEVRRAMPLLSEAVAHVGHPTIRHRGTVGGSLAHADSASELPATALALDAELTVLSVEGSRTIPAADFFQGPFTTAKRWDELVTEVRFPIWPARGSGGCFMEFSRRHGDFAVVGVAVMLNIAGGRLTQAAVSLCGVSITPVRATEAERQLIGAIPSRSVAHAAAEAATAGLEPSSDIHATSAFRRHLAETYVERAVECAVQRAEAQL